jgi:DNA-binding beta-propeller fold protein YncE
LAILLGCSLFIADGRNNRIQHINIDGQVIIVWGSFADVSTGEAPAGTFNEPWGIAVAPDGSVYVTDHGITVFKNSHPMDSLWPCGGRLDRGIHSDAFLGAERDRC